MSLSNKWSFLSTVTPSPFRPTRALTSPLLFSPLLNITSNNARYQAARCYSTKTSEPNAGSLNGLRVLDVTRILAGPFCTQIFADYGADVLKVEQRGVGDDTRHWKVKGEAASWSTDTPISYYFASVNRNKRSITIDLKKQAGLDILYKLARTSDVFVENFIPGKAKELGFGYEKLKEINPKLVYASISGYGGGGPYSGRAGYDAIAAAEGGLMHITGEAGRAPVRPGLGMVGTRRHG
jgi:succinate---hydroxymethylglutarate CoA-transferase